MPSPILVVFSEVDPVARAVHDAVGPLAASGLSVDGAPVRRWSEEVLTLVRPGRHVTDERLDARLPSELRDRTPTLVFPSIHRSERGVPCFTVHPIGNLGPVAEVGGRPRCVVPSAPRLMADALRRLREAGRAVGLPATYESTHHGPYLELPAFFVEIGFGEAAAAPEGAVRVLARLLPELTPDPADRVVLGVGGGHYAPHFGELAVARRWAFGHIVSRHALDMIDAPTAQRLVAATPECSGAIFARAQDALEGPGRLFLPRRRENEAPRRATPEDGAPTPGRDGSPASGT